MMRTTARLSRLSKWRLRGQGHLRVRGPPCTGGGLRTSALMKAGSMFAVRRARRTIWTARFFAERPMLIVLFAVISYVYDPLYRYFFDDDWLHRRGIDSLYRSIPEIGPNFWFACGL